MKLTAAHIIRSQQSLEGSRSNWESHWDEVARYVFPNYTRSFQRQDVASEKGGKLNIYQFDTFAELAMDRLASIVKTLVTPESIKWHDLRPQANVPLTHEQVVGFDAMRDALFQYRMAPKGNFNGQWSEALLSYVAFGNGVLFVDQLDPMPGDPGGGIRYRCIPMHEVFFSENHQGLIDVVHRRFRLTARQAVSMFPDTCPAKIRQHADLPERGEDDKKWEFIHYVGPNSDYDPDKPEFSKAFKSCYVSKEEQSIVREGYYGAMPYVILRYKVAPGEIYGRGPGMAALPAIKVLNKEKENMLRHQTRLADTTYLAADDGILDVTHIIPGTVVSGGISNNGNKLVQPLDVPQGQFERMVELMSMEKEAIASIFMLDLFQILTDTPEMTATEVMERTREKAMLLSPIMGRLQSESLYQLIERELDVLSQQDLLPPIPDWDGVYRIEYTSPFATSLRAQEAAGFQRLVQFTTEISAGMQRPDLLDHINFDAAIPALSEIFNSPSAWLASPEQVQEIRDSRAEQQQAQQMIDAAPAAAGMMKAMQ